MCGGRPCFTSVCGVSLQKTVTIIGFVQLGMTVIATILNVVKMSQGYDPVDCDEKDICIGPIIKFAVLDALFGITSSLMLIFGAKSGNRCLLIFWIIITVAASIKYLYIVCTRDWTSLEDWISISYLVFYLAVTLIVFSLMTEMQTNQGHVHGPAIQAMPANTTFVISQQIPLQPQPLGYYPPPQQPTPPYTQQAPYNSGH